MRRARHLEAKVSTLGGHGGVVAPSNGDQTVRMVTDRSHGQLSYLV